MLFHAAFSLIYQSLTTAPAGTILTSFPSEQQKFGAFLQIGLLSSDFFPL